MRVLLVGENHRAEIRGRTIAIHGLALALRDRGHQVTLVQAARPEHRVRLEGIESRYVSTTRKSRYPLIFGFLGTRGFDVVHTNDEAGAWLALRSRLQPLPLVAQFQPPHVRREPFLRANWRWRYIEMAARLAPQVLCPSRWLADALVDRYGLDPGHVHAVPYGIAEAWFKARREPDSSTGGELRVALINMKGVDVALRAFAKAAEQTPARLELYGVVKPEDDTLGLARRLGIEDRVSLRGFVPHEELPAQVAGADLLLHPARGESFGQVLGEAAALGVPSVASRVNAIPEVVADGETGLLCPVDDVPAFANALAQLLSDSALRRRMALAARRRAERLWRWSEVVERLERDVYALLPRAR